MLFNGEFVNLSRDQGICAAQHRPGPLTAPRATACWSQSLQWGNIKSWSVTHLQFLGCFCTSKDTEMTGNSFFKIIFIRVGTVPLGSCLLWTAPRPPAYIKDPAPRQGKTGLKNVTSRFESNWGWSCGETSTSWISHWHSDAATSVCSAPDVTGFERLSLTPDRVPHRSMLTPGQSKPLCVQPDTTKAQRKEAESPLGWEMREDSVPSTPRGG